MLTAKNQVLDPDIKVIVDVAADDPSLDRSQKWRQSTLDLITYWTGMKQCYSSGAFSAALRETRPDAMIFSHPSVGEYLRDMFYQGLLPDYADENGLPVKVVQVSRVTEGLYPDRTRAGVEVFVYGPSVEACQEYEFEVFIPNPAKGETMANAPAPAVGQTALAKADKSGKTKTAVAIMGDRIRNQDIEAKVWPDGRLCVPRSAFEAIVHLGGTPMQGGDPVYVTIGKDKITITLSPTGDTNEKTYDLTTGSGRIAITGSFDSRKVYKVTVSSQCATIDL